MDSGIRACDDASELREGRGSWGFVDRDVAYLMMWLLVGMEQFIGKNTLDAEKF